MVDLCADLASESDNNTDVRRQLSPHDTDVRRQLSPHDAEVRRRLSVILARLERVHASNLSAML